MNLFRITMTGADDGTDPKRLLEISKKYPKVEWGILVESGTRGRGFGRFPSMVWRESLVDVYDKSMHLSCHLCGRYVNEALMGFDYFKDNIGSIWDCFERVQLNTHGMRHPFKVTSLLKLLERHLDKEFIFQCDDENNEMFEQIKHMPNVSTLFDLSHGAGILPSKWPSPIEGVKCGYAGGLSPDNVQEQISLITEKVGEREAWIDMERHIRTDDGLYFDLNKVVKVLDICDAMMIKNEA